MTIGSPAHDFTYGESQPDAGATDAGAGEETNDAGPSTEEDAGASGGKTW